MSNVLIGIIGVILFIGLALAGTLILGDDFRSSKADSRASAAIQTMTQVANAANMHRVKIGSAPNGGTLGGLVPRFLKSVPINPTGGKAPDMHSASSNYTGAAVFSVMEIADANACKSINQQLGTSDTVPTLNDYPAWQAGCYRQGTARGFNTAGTHVGFVRI